MVKINWTDSAIQDLEDIGDYIAKDSVRYAEITVSQLFRSVDIIEDHIRIGVIVSEFENDSIRQIVRGNYRIIYYIVDEFRVDILTVQNCARLISNIKIVK